MFGGGVRIPNLILISTYNNRVVPSLVYYCVIFSSYWCSKADNKDREQHLHSSIFHSLQL